MMRFVSTVMLLICSTACFGQSSLYTAKQSSWVVVIGAVKECPQFKYRLLDAQYLKNRDSVQLIGTSMNDLIGMTSNEIRSELQSRGDLSPEVLPESLKVLVFKAALPPPVIKRIIVQAGSPAANDCMEPENTEEGINGGFEYQDPWHRQEWLHRTRPRPFRYEGDGPHDISIVAAKAVA